MRWFLPLLLATSAVAGETRAWRGEIRVRATGRLSLGSRGHDEHTEKIRVVLVTGEPNKDVKNPPTPLTMRRGKGTYSLDIDVKARHVATKGRKDGLLHPTVSGVIDPAAGTYKLRVQATPRRLVVIAMLSGTHRGGFRTWRTTIERGSFLGVYTLSGKVAGAVLSGRRTFVDRNAGHTRDVVVEWRIERVDPNLRGRVLDHLGRPVPGVTIHARTTNPERAKKKLPPHYRRGKTDDHGRFSVAAFWSHWRVTLQPLLRDGVVYAAAGAAGIDLKFDHAPKRELVMRAYRLSALPDPHLLEKHFRGDVAAYLDYVRPRAGEEGMKRAEFRDE